MPLKMWRKKGTRGSRMNKVDCCYNCKHGEQGWVIVKDSSQQTMMCDVLKEFVKPNNKCEKWGESRMMKVKCAIPSRIKECGWCEHYTSPYIITTSEGETVDSPPICRAGRDLPTQKAPCPSYEKRRPCIYGNRRAE